MIDYAPTARNLANTLMAFARDRREDDKKLIAQLHTELCKLRREELLKQEDVDHEPRPDQTTE